jgi:hypothetical protein
MKSLFILLLQLGFNASVCLAQVPNGNFEEWQTIDSIENPVYWETNNYYVGYTPIAKTTDAIQGSYSMKISSTAKDFWGTATGYGCAHVKIVPTQEYKYLTASVKIDTMDTEGEVSIRVKQWQQSIGLYDNIGTWKTTGTTNGIIQVILPIEQVGLDTVLIEVWAKNHFDPLIGFGYTEMVIDNLQLTTVVATKESKNNYGWVIYPNPATNAINIRLEQPVSKPITLRLLDIKGRLVQSYYFPPLSTISLHLDDVLPGIYLLETVVQGEIVYIEKFIVEK